MRLLLGSLFVLQIASGQVAEEANRTYRTPEARANIAKRLDNPDRLANIRPAQLVARLSISPGSTVVDLGTGTGNLLESLSKAVGPKGRVIAEDIFPDFLERARAKAQTLKLTNIDYVLGSERDPRLPAASADLILILDAYHHFDYPQDMLAALKRSLKPGGRVAIVEYHKKRGAMEGDPDYALQHIRASDTQVRQELEAAGFQFLSQHEHAPGSQYLALFRLP